MKIVAETNGRKHPYAPQLEIQTCSLAPGKEWTPQRSRWSLIQLASGSGYWLQGQSRTELETGTIVLHAGTAPARILASCLNGLALQFFSVVPERLMGLLTQREHDFLKSAVAKRREFHRVLEPPHPMALKMRNLCETPDQGGLGFRLMLLQLWVEVIGKDWEGAEIQPQETDEAPADVKERLREFLMATPPAALLEVNFEGLAKVLHCTPRHLSRVFYEVTGTSFREKRAEIRLSRARELLATSQFKVVDVAYKSGFKSLSLFNRMFTERFGISPGRWRQKNDTGGDKALLEPRGRKLPITVDTSRLGRG